MPDIVAISGGALLGLLVGSFLNVVIYRLPVMMERAWRKQAREVLADDAPALTASATTDSGSGSQDSADRTLEDRVPEDEEEPFNLVTPRSRCQNCGTPVAAWQNIPVISWLLLRGRCATCKAPISARYPLIELVTGLLSALVIWQFGTGLAGMAGLGFVWALIALTMIDIDHQLLPDSITYPLLWAGLLLSLFHDPSANLPFPAPADAIAGAAAGYLSLWSVYWLFKLVTGKEGMGYGDFKLLAALGAWLGWQMLPLIILLSAVVGTVVGIGMILLLGRDRQLPIPFGPYLAGAGLIALLWGDTLMVHYLRMSGL